MNDDIRQRNIQMYNEVVRLVDLARSCGSHGDLEDLQALDDAQGVVRQMPIVDSTDVLLEPRVVLERADALMSLSRDADALSALHAAHEMIDRIVQRAADDPELDSGAGELTAHLASLAVAADSGELAHACVGLDYHQARRVAAVRSTDPDAQLRLLSAVGRMAETVAERNLPAALRLMEPALPVARWLGQVAADDVTAIANAAAFVMNIARMKAGAGLLTNADLALVDEFIALLDRQGDRGESAQRAASLRFLRGLCEQLQERATSAAQQLEQPANSPPTPAGPLLTGRHTLSGVVQPVPEALGALDRRSRLYEYVKASLARLPQTQHAAIGQPLGDGAGMEELVRLIEPIFAKERSLIRWVALRGALAAMSQLGSEVWFDVFPAMVGLEFFEEKATGLVGFRFKDRSLASGTRMEHACGGLAASILSRVVRYDDIVKMTVEQVNASTDFETRGVVNDAIALDYIAWIATAELRLEAAVGASLNTRMVPEPSRLDAPGWYVEPLFSKGERYWDGNDWTPWARVMLDGGYHVHQLSLR